MKLIRIQMESVRLKYPPKKMYTKKTWGGYNRSSTPVLRRVHMRSQKHGVQREYLATPVFLEQ